MAMKTYYDFAQNDYEYFSDSYERGAVWNSMAALAQNSCEKYLKHLIDRYQEVNSRSEMLEKTDNLHSHSLSKLIRHLEANTDIRVPADAKAAMVQINGYYYSTRYPGDDSIEVNEEDIANCKIAIEKCKELTDRTIIRKEHVNTVNAMEKLIDSDQIPQNLKGEIIKESMEGINLENISEDILEKISELCPELNIKFAIEYDCEEDYER